MSIEGRINELALLIERTCEEHQVSACIVLAKLNEECLLGCDCDSKHRVNSVELFKQMKRCLEE